MTNKLTTLIASALISLLLVACVSGSDDVASLRTTGDTQAVEPAVDAAAVLRDDEAAMMAYTQCMRDQGIELLDPVVDADGNVQKPELAEGFEASKEKWAAADAACGELIERVTFGKKRVDMSETVDQWVALATCLREEGLDVDDPTAETLEIWLTDFKTAIDWDDPDIVQAYESCTGTSQGGNGGKGK